MSPTPLEPQHSNNLTDFASTMFGIELKEESKDQKFQRIQQLQKELMKLIDSINTVTNTDNFKLAAKHLEGAMFTHPFISNFALDAATFRDDSTISKIEYFSAPMRAYFSAYMNRLPYLATIFVSMPFLKYDLLLQRNRLSWMADNGVMLSVSQRQYNDILRAGNLPSHTKSQVRGILRNLEPWTATLPLATLQCPAPQNAAAMKSYLNPVTHPHTNMGSSPFSDICFGNNRFLINWRESRIQNVSDFLDFIDGASFWVSHHNLSDCYSNSAFPGVIGAKHSEVVTQEMWELALDIVNELSEPLLRAFEQRLPKDSALISITEMPAEFLETMRVAGLRLPQYLDDLKNRLQSFPLFIQAVPIEGTQNFVIEGSEESSNFNHRRRNMLDACRLALEELVRFTHQQIEDDTGQLWETLLALRETAYSIVLLRLCSHPEQREQLGNNDPGSLFYYMSKVNMFDMLRYNILLGANYSNLAPSGRLRFLDFGYRKGLLTRERIMAPRVLAKLFALLGFDRPVWLSKLEMNNITDNDFII